MKRHVTLCMLQEGDGIEMPGSYSFAVVRNGDIDLLQVSTKDTYAVVRHWLPCSCNPHYPSNIVSCPENLCIANRSLDIACESSLLVALPKSSVEIIVSQT
jgi:hypothetical protein